MGGDHPNGKVSSCDAMDEDGPLCYLSETVSERAADKAVKKVFAILGVDINKPESVEEFREDLRFGKKLRKLADHGILAVVGLVFAGIGYAVWAGFVALLLRK